MATYQQEIYNQFRQSGVPSILSGLISEAMGAYQDLHAEFVEEGNKLIAKEVAERAIRFYDYALNTVAPHYQKVKLFDDRQEELKVETQANALQTIAQDRHRFYGGRGAALDSVLINILSGIAKIRTMDYFLEKFKEDPFAIHAIEIPAEEPSSEEYIPGSGSLQA